MQKIHDWIVSFHWLSKKKKGIHIWKIENYMVLGPSYKVPNNYMAFSPSYKLPKIKIRPRSTYPKILNSKVRLRNGKVLDTHFAQIESGLLDSCDQCTPLCMLWMTCCTYEKKIKSHKFIYECILFFVKNLDMCWCE